jgi:hypothetical protein
MNVNLFILAILINDDSTTFSTSMHTSPRPPTYVNHLTPGPIGPVI